MNTSVKLGDAIIGDNNPCFIVVELGVCHEQNIEVAEHFIEVASEAGANAVKVESFQADELVLDKTITHCYGTTDGVVTENYYQLLKRLELGYDDYARLKKKSDECGILFFPTVATKKSISVFQDLDVCAFKLASPDIVHYPLQRFLAKMNKPIFLDTGGSFIHEVEKAILNLNDAGAKDIILMHNPSGYPAPPDKTDVRIIQTLKHLFQVPVGLSCHTPGLDVVMASLALGANVIEKPVSRDQAIKSPEHIFSFLDSEAMEIVQRIRNMETALGAKRRTSVNENSLSRFIGRRGIYSARDLDVGEILSEDNIVLAKPEHGISVVMIDQVLGRTIRRHVKKHQPITWDDI